MSERLQAFQASLPSIIGEERRGRPGTARELALVAARDEPGQRVLWQLLAAHAALAVGDARDALRLLAEIPAQVEPAIARRVLACRAWAQMLDLNWYPDNEGAEIPPGGFDGIIPFGSVSQGDPETVHVENCAANGPRMALTFRNVVSNAARKAAALAPDTAAKCLGSLDIFIQIAQSIQANSAICWAAASKADLLWRAGQREQSEQLLSQVRAAHVQMNDPLGSANTWLLEGDWWATPGSRPEALGLVLSESDFVPPYEADVQRAKRAYQEAEAALGKLDAPLVHAALELRFALLAGRERRFEESQAHLSQSARAYARAGDRAGGYLVRVHAWLADLERGELQAVRPHAPLEFAKPHGLIAEILAWGAEHGSLSYCTGLGRLLQRAGERWFAAAQYDQAELAYRLASRLVLANGAVASWVIPEALSQLDTRRNFTTRALARRLQLLDLLPPPVAPSSNPIAWLQDLQLSVGLLTVHSGVVGASEMAERTVERVEKRLDLLIKLAGFEPVTQLRTIDDAKAALERARAAFETALAAQLRGELPAEGATSETLMIDLAVAQARMSFATARPLSALLRARRAERAGWLAQSDQWYESALKAAAAGRAEARWLQIVVLNAWGKRPEARQALTEALAENVLPRSQLAALAALIGAYPTAHEVFKTLAPEPGLPNWRDDADRAFVECLCADSASGLAQIIQVVESFEATLEHVARDADRIAICDDVSVASLYLSAARSHLHCARKAEALGDTAGAAAQRSHAFAVTDRLRSLVLPPDLGTETSSTLLQWQQLATEYTTTYQRLLAAVSDGGGVADDRVSELREAVAAAERALAEIEAQLSPAQQQAVARARQPIRFSVEAVQRHLPPGACLIEYQVVGRDYLAFAISAHSAYIHESRTGRDTVDGIVSRVLDACSKGSPGQDALVLSELLLAPFADVLATCERVIVVPSGPLHGLPFHVLPFQHQPFGETHVVSYLPAASLLARDPADQPLTKGEVLVVGDPAFDPSAHPELRRLAGAAVEAYAVAKLYGAKEPLIAEAATEPKLRALIADCALIHLAAHGRLDVVAPNTSSIVLAGVDELTVSDLIGLQLQADLVVLSACDTGRGTTTLGGDLVGLTRGLLAAGVRRCIVSLWPVDDVAACVTMAAFHRVLCQPDAPAPAFALARAQREIRKLTRQEIGERYRSLGGTLSRGERSLRRQANPVLEPFSERDEGDNDEAADADSGREACTWAPFVLIGA